jgi:hypothetical protein
VEVVVALDPLEVQSPSQPLYPLKVKHPPPLLPPPPSNHLHAHLPFKNNKKRHNENPSLTLKIKKTKFKSSSSNFKQIKEKRFLSYLEILISPLALMEARSLAFSSLDRCTMAFLTPL